MIHAEGCPYGRHDSAVHDGPCTQVAGYVVPKRLAQTFEEQARTPAPGVYGPDQGVVMSKGIRECCLTDPAAVHEPGCPVRVSAEVEAEPLAPVAGGEPMPVHEWRKMSHQGEDVLHDQPRFSRAELVNDPAPADDVDMVNHPPHYKGPAHRACGEPLECIDVVRDKPFNVGNAIKYLWRAGAKHDQIEDLRKAVWYIEDEIKRLEEQP